MCFAAACRNAAAICESPEVLLLLLQGGIVDNCTKASLEGAAISINGLRILNASDGLFQNPLMSDCPAILLWFSVLQKFGVGMR